MKWLSFILLALTLCSCGSSDDVDTSAHCSDQYVASYTDAQRAYYKTIDIISSGAIGKARKRQQISSFKSTANSFLSNFGNQNCEAISKSSQSIMTAEAATIVGYLNDIDLRESLL